MHVSNWVTDSSQLLSKAYKQKTVLQFNNESYSLQSCSGLKFSLLLWETVLFLWCRHVSESECHDSHRVLDVRTGRGGQPKRFVSDRWWTVDKRWTDFWGGAPYTCILSDGWWGDSSCGKAALLTSDFIKHLRFHRDPVLNQAVLW